MIQVHFLSKRVLILDQLNKMEVLTKNNLKEFLLIARKDYIPSDAAVALIQVLFNQLQR